MVAEIIVDGNSGASYGHTSLLKYAVDEAVAGSPVINLSFMQVSIPHEYETEALTELDIGVSDAEGVTLTHDLN
jgi:hypothetical protein